MIHLKAKNKGVIYLRVDIRKLEQFLKRNLKRKISMSVGTVICYLLTGGFAFGQDYIEVT